MDNKIYRKVSIDRLSSPEQLDKMITITSSKTWYILLSLGFILLTVIVWSLTGNLTTNITAHGMLVKSGGIIDVASSYDGQVSDIRVSPGDTIKKGDIVARLDQRKLVDEITELSEQIEFLKENNADAVEINAASLKREDLKKKLQSSSVIVSQEEGRVIEVTSKLGDIVTPGSVVLRIVKEGEGVKDLIAVLYVPVESGKRLAPGMEARISPSTVNKEEYGYILGRVVSVSEYAVTVSTAQQKLGSYELAAEYAGNAACLEVIVDLVTDEHTKSGYRWSTLSGPSNIIENGTVCSASVIIKKEHPIELMIPQIRKLIN